MSDLGPAGGFEAFVKLGVEIRDGIKRLGDRWTAKPEALVHPVIVQATSGASGNLVFGLGGPPMGRRWLVRSVTVGGTLTTSTPAGTAYLLQATSQPDPAVPPTMSFRDKTSNPLPQVAFYGRGEIALDNPDKLWVVIVAPTASTQYVGRASVEDVELGTGTRAP